MSKQYELNLNSYEY